MATTSLVAVTAEGQESLDPGSEFSLSRSPGNGSEPSGFCTSCGVLANGSDATTNGDERKRAFEAGRKMGATTYFQSPVMKHLAKEITLLRALVDVMAEHGKQMQWERDFWLAKFKDAVHVIGSPKK